LKTRSPGLKSGAGTKTLTRGYWLLPLYAE
jgi:hypothetical protein